MTTKSLIKNCYVNITPFKVSKIHPDAEIPFKEESEVHAAFDVIVVARCDNRAEDVYGDINTFSTGLVITPPPHYHMEVIGHPLLLKTGYMIPGTTIINRDNQEELVLSLYKFKEGDDLELPFKVAQLLLRTTEYSPIKVDALPQRKQSRMPVFEEEEHSRPSNKSGARPAQKRNHLF